MNNLLVEPQPTGPALLKVSDFAYSKNALLDSRPKTMIGDFAYTCPELLLGLRTEEGQDTGRYVYQSCCTRNGGAVFTYLRVLLCARACSLRHVYAYFMRLFVIKILSMAQGDKSPSWMQDGRYLGLRRHPLQHANWPAAIQGGVINALLLACLSLLFCSISWLYQSCHLCPIHAQPRAWLHIVQGWIFKIAT